MTTHDEAVLQANLKYIEKNKSFLEKIFFSINRDELYENVNKLISEYSTLLKEIDGSNIEPEIKIKLRIILKNTYIHKVKSHSDFQKSHVNLVGTIIGLLKSIHRHYNILNRTEDEIQTGF